MLCEFHIDLLKYKVHVCNLEANLRITRKALFQKAHHQHFWLHKRLYQMIKTNIKLSSVQFSCSVVSDSLKPHGLHHARPPCPSPTPGVYWNSCPSSWWCHPTISSSVIPFSSHLLAFPTSGSFLMSQLFASGGQSIGASASASVLPMNIQGWFPWNWLVWSPCSPGDFQESSPAPQFKSIHSLALSLRYDPTLTSVPDYWENYIFG